MLGRRPARGRPGASDRAHGDGRRVHCVRREAEDRLELRADVDARRRIGRRVEVQDGRDALDEVPVGLVRLAETARRAPGGSGTSLTACTRTGGAAPCARLDVLVRLDARRRGPVDHAEDAAPLLGLADDDLERVRGRAEDPAHLGDGLDRVQDVDRERVAHRDRRTRARRRSPARSATATSTSSSSLPLRRTRHGPLASLKAMPNRIPGTCTQASCRSSTVLMKCDWPTITFRSSGLSNRDGRDVHASPPRRRATSREGIRSPRAWRVARASREIRGTTLDRSSHSLGPWSSPPIGPRPSSVGHAGGRGRVRVRGTAGRRVAAARTRARAPPRSRGAASLRAALLLLHRPVPGAARDVDRDVGDACARRRSLDGLGLGLLRTSPPRGDRTSTSITHRSATTFGPRPAVHDAHVHGHAGPAAVQRLKRDGLVGRLEDRAAAAIGLDARVRRAPPTISIRKSEHALARGDDVAVLAGALEHERRVGLAPPAARIVVARPGRADLLVGVADVRDRCRTRRSPAVLQRPRRRRTPARSPPFMSETPGPSARSPSMRKGRSATVPGSKTVSVCPIIRSTRGPPEPSRRPITRSPSRAPRRAARGPHRSTDQPRAANRASHRSAISFTPSGVYEPQSTLTIRSSAAMNSSRRAAAIPSSAWRSIEGGV